jgi:hypothetical protein
MYICYIIQIHCISKLIWYARARSSCDQFLNQGRLLTDKLMLQGFLQSQVKFASSKVVITIWFTNTSLHRVKCCPMCFITICWAVLTHWFDSLCTWFGNKAHSRCDQSTGDYYFSLAPNPTSGLSRDPGWPNLPDLYFMRFLRLITVSYITLLFSLTNLCNIHIC